MSFKTFFHNIFHSNAAAAAVTAVQQSPEGAAILAAINTAESTALSGPEKLAQVLPVAVTAVESLAAKGGVTKAVDGIETMARNVIEAFLSAGAPELIAAIMKAI